MQCQEPERSQPESAPIVAVRTILIVIPRLIFAMPVWLIAAHGIVSSELCCIVVNCRLFV